MPVNTAKNHFLGKEGFKRMNCAQSVISAFKDKFSLNSEIIDSFSTYGAGIAPGGLCGALYAAKFILEKNAEGEQSTELEKYFLVHAGAIKCNEIKSCKKLSCLGCVEKSTEFLKKVHNE